MPAGPSARSQAIAARIICAARSWPCGSKLPPSARADQELEQLSWLGCTTTMQIVHLIYQNEKYETATKDYEFSRASIAGHRAAGYRDAMRAIAERKWEQPVPPNVGVMVYEYPPRNVGL